MPPPEVHDDGHDSQGGIDPLTAAQLDALTEAINQLSARLGPSAVGGTPNTLAPPWWFKGGMNRPDAPDAPPPGSAAAMDAGSPWWNRYTDPASGASPFTYVRSHWRAPRAPRPPQVMPSAAQVTQERAGAASAAASAITSTTADGGGDYPESVYQVAAATGESPDEIAAAMGIKGRRGGGRGKPPGGGPPGGGGLNDGPNDEPPWAKAWQSPAWNRRRKQSPWHWNVTRKIAGAARLRFGRRTGKAVTVGMSAAARRLMFSGSVSSAARVGVFAGAAAGGAAAAGVVILAGAAIKAAEALNKLTAEQLTYNRHLASASAQMAFVFAQRDVQERMRQREVGDRLAISAGRLTAAEQFKEDNTKEIGIAWNRLKNEIGTVWELFKGTLFFQLNAELGVLNRIQEFLEGNWSGQKYLNMDEYVRGLAQQDAAARKNKDPKWQPPTFK